MEAGNKYYTPSIAEFHQGFEFEARISETDNYHPFTLTYVSGEWGFVSKKMSAAGAIHEEWIEPKSIRVKWLDLQDVEDCGWKPSPDEPDERFDGYKGHEDLQLYFDDKMRKGTSSDNEEGFSYIQGVGITIYRDSGIIFDGFIRNKSHFKEIMESLDLDPIKIGEGIWRNIEQK